MPWWKVLGKYAIFEAGDSAWSLIVVSSYFGTFLQAVFHRPGAELGWAVTAGSLAIAALSPLLGAAIDNSGRRQPYLRLFVFGAVLCTASLAWAPSALWALVLFVIAYICVNGAFFIFTAMTPAVSNQNTVSGVVSLAVGAGYAGGLVCMLALSRLVKSDVMAGRVFAPMAVMYLLFALPAMYLAPDFAPRSGRRADLGAAYRRMRDTFRQARRYRFLLRFLVADFLYENAVASVITLMGLYSRNIMGFAADELVGLFGPAILVAMLSAWFVFGPLIRILGPKRVVLIDLAIWVSLLMLVLLIEPGTSLDVGSLHAGSKTLFSFCVAPLAGMGLAGVWSASRVLLTALTPAAKSGEFWGLYNLSGRTASVLGDATWSLSLTLLGEQLPGYHAAVVALCAYVIAGALLIASLPDARPAAENFV